MKKLRILHVHDKPGAGGGIATHVAAARAALQDAGYEAGELVLTSGVADTLASPTTAPRTYDPIRGKLKAGAVIDAIARTAPDIVHLHAGFTAIAAPVLTAILRHWPTIATLHDVAPFCPKGTRLTVDGEVCVLRSGGRACLWSGCASERHASRLPGLIAHQAVKTGLLTAWRKVGHVIAPSRYIRDLTIQHGFDQSAISIAPHFTQVPELAPAPANRPPLILFVGALTWNKGAELLIEALARIKDRPWQAALVGEGALREELARRAGAHGLSDRITFPGRLDAAAVALYRQASAMAVMPSLQPESFGLAGLESLAAARPVVGFAIGGVADWLHQDDTGIVVGTVSAAALADGLSALLDDPDRAARLGANGRDFVARSFGAAQFVTQVSSLYNSLAAH